jgi:hypothetical protein
LLDGVRSIPATYLLDREGNLVATRLRGEALEAKIAEVCSWRWITFVCAGLFFLALAAGSRLLWGFEFFPVMVMHASMCMAIVLEGRWIIETGSVFCFCRGESMRQLPLGSR